MTNQELSWCFDLARYAGWPVEFAEAGFELLGAGVLNTNGRTFKALDRLAGHALRVWEEKYGPLTEEQEKYAGKLLAWAVERAHDHGNGDPGKTRALLYSFVPRLVNEDKVHAGFRRRAHTEDDVDHSELLAGLPR